jgi:hypothetical protein
MCQVFIIDNQYIPRVSLLTQKLAHFLSDSIFFVPLAQSEVVVSSSQSFAQISYSKQFDSTLQQLSESLDLNSIYRAYQAFDGHECPDQVDRGWAIPRLRFRWISAAVVSPSSQNKSAFEPFRQRILRVKQSLS